MPGKRAGVVAYAALLRAVNLPSHGKIAMAELRAFLTALGFGDPHTLLQSGNAVFTSDTPEENLEALLEREAASRLGLTTEFFVRTGAELREVMARNPYPGDARDDPSHLVVLFMKQPPAPETVDALRAAIKGRETVTLDGRHAYVRYPDGIGDSKLTNAVIERHLGVRVTGRNWNTVGKLAALT